MRSALPLSLSAFIAMTLLSCATPTTGSDSLAYDGSADDMDSLPDCGPETQGSLFWVKARKSAFECEKGNQWKVRKNARKPDDSDEDEDGGISPRIVK